MIDEQSSASGHDYASDRSAIWAGRESGGSQGRYHSIIEMKESGV